MHTSPFNSGILKVGALGILALTSSACGASLAKEPNFPPADVQNQICYDFDTEQRPHSFAADFALARYHTDGQIDRSFGEDGTAVVDFGHDREAISALAVQDTEQEQEIVVAGYSSETAIALARFLPDGRLDPTFGSGGTVRRLLYETAEEAQAQTSDIVDPVLNEQVNLVTAANGDLLVIAERPWQQDSDQPGFGRQDIVLLRYDRDGQLDERFGSGGQVVLELGGAASIHDVAQQPDGKLVVVGRLDPELEPRPDRMLVGRLLPDGTPDEEFGRGGWVKLDLSHEDVADAVAIAADGNLWIGGYWRPRFGPNFPLQMESPVWTLLRLNPDGSRDRAFGRGGIIRGDRRSPGQTYIRELNPLEDGTLLVASPGHLLAQYLPQERTLQPLPLLKNQVPEPFLYPSDAVVQNDAVTLLGGGAYGTIQDCPHLSHYGLDGRIDEGFGDRGFVSITPDLNRSLVLEASGEFLWIGGNTEHEN